jgi:hypothetical protein
LDDARPNCPLSGIYFRLVGCRKTVGIRRFSGSFRKFPEGFPVEIKIINAVGGDRTHNLRITDLILYLPATAAI